MSLGPHASHPDRDEADGAADSSSIVPGMDRPGRPVPLDRSQDPDRFDPDREPDPVPEMPRDLDPDDDPDRFSVASRTPGPGADKGNSGQGLSLPDLLGKAGTHEGDRDNYEWAYGLLAVLVFLGLVSFLFNNVLSP